MVWQGSSIPVLDRARPASTPNTEMAIKEETASNQLNEGMRKFCEPKQKVGAGREFSEVFKALTLDKRSVIQKHEGVGRML